MSFHPSQDPHSAYMDAGYTVDYSVHEEQVTTEYICGILLFKEDFVKVDENYDPTEFFTGLGGGMVGEQHVNGAGTGNGQVRSEISDKLEFGDIFCNQFFSSSE